MNPLGWACPRRIGFLFPHPCGRLSPIGCPDCNNGEIDDPYNSRTDRDVYTTYDDYDPNEVGALGSDDSIDFSEADGEDLIRPEEEFEDDLNES